MSDDANMAPGVEIQQLPEILLEPLHILDPLCIKWKLSKLGVPVYVPEPIEDTLIEPLQPPAANPSSHRSAPPTPSSAQMAPVPTSAKMSQGYIRLIGMRSDNSLWDCSIPMSDMARGRGITIGRDVSCCDVVLPESSISRRHLLLEVTENGTIVATDLQTTNGTFLNNRRLMPHEQRIPLADGNTLTLGDITLRVDIMPPISSSYIPL